MSRLRSVSVILLFAFQVEARGDDLLYRWECDVPPWQADWILGSCTYPCSWYREDGHFVVRWETAALGVQLLHRFEPPGGEQPSSLWVEWSFRSNLVFPWQTYNCGANFRVHYLGIVQGLNTYGNATISGGGDDVVCCYDLDEFHTFRFESADGENFSFSVDGALFQSGYESIYPGTADLLIVSQTGCQGDEEFPIINEWDFVRYGTLTDGEQIIASDPPGGFVDARACAPLDRFTITFDQPGYVYIDDVGVLVDGSSKPEVIATRRRDNGPPDELEIVLDRPIPFNATTFFHFATGASQPQVVSFTFAPGDTDGDGDADLADFSYLANCFSESPPGVRPLSRARCRCGSYGGCGGLRLVFRFGSSLISTLRLPPWSPLARRGDGCEALDSNGDDDIDLSDLAAFQCLVFATP